MARATPHQGPQPLAGLQFARITGPIGDTFIAVPKASVSRSFGFRVASRLPGDSAVLQPRLLRWMLDTLDAPAAIALRACVRGAGYSLDALQEGLGQQPVPPPTLDVYTEDRGSRVLLFEALDEAQTIALTERLWGCCAAFVCALQADSTWTQLAATVEQSEGASARPLGIEVAGGGGFSMLDQDASLSVLTVPATTDAAALTAQFVAAGAARIGRK